MVEVIEVSRAAFVEAMTKAPALDAVRVRGHWVWPKGSVGWWNELVQTCDELARQLAERADG